MDDFNETFLSIQLQQKFFSLSSHTLKHSMICLRAGFVLDSETFAGGDYPRKLSQTSIVRLTNLKILEDLHVVILQNDFNYTARKHVSCKDQQCSKISSNLGYVRGDTRLKKKSYSSLFSDHTGRVVGI